MGNVAPRLACALVAVACSKPPAPPPGRVETPPIEAGAVVADVVAVPPDASADAAPDAGGLGPLAGEAVQRWQSDDLDVVAVLPIGAREKRPVVVGVHGSADRPDQTCARWRETLADFAFVVCPKGVSYKRGLAWGSPLVLAERADRAVALLRERYGAWVADGPVTYAGWSLGGTLGPEVVAARPGTYDRSILVEVGHTRLDARKAASRLRSGKVSHVIVSCATRRCLAFGKRLEHEWGSGLTINDGGIGRGHLFDALMFRTLGRTIATVVAADARWAGFSETLAAKFGPAEP